MLIYQILNKINGKSYIGQTTNPTFNGRYSGGRWWDTTNNPMLKNAVTKHGIDNFEVTILVQNVESIERLNELEIHYANEFKTYKPHGYNLRGCGNNSFLLPDHIEALRKHASRHHTLRKIDTWELVEIFNLKQFCRDHDLDAGGFSNMMTKKGNIKASQGYCLPETSREEVKRHLFRLTLKKPISMLTPKGDKIVISNLKQFCVDNHLHRPSLTLVIEGKQLHHQGFRLPDRREEHSQHEVRYELKSPTGEIVTGSNISQLCREHGLTPECIRQVCLGQMLEHRGWTLPSTTSMDLFMRRTHGIVIMATLVDPSGQIFETDNLRYFCRDDKSLYRGLYAAGKRHGKSHRGWQIKSFTISARESEVESQTEDKDGS